MPLGLAAAANGFRMRGSVLIGHYRPPHTYTYTCTGRIEQGSTLAYSAVHTQDSMTQALSPLFEFAVTVHAAIIDCPPPSQP